MLLDQTISCTRSPDLCICESGARIVIAGSFDLSFLEERSKTDKSLKMHAKVAGKFCIALQGKASEFRHLPVSGRHLPGLKRGRENSDEVVLLRNKLKALTCLGAKSLTAASLPHAEHHVSAFACRKVWQTFGRTKCGTCRGPCVLLSVAAEEPSFTSKPLYLIRQHQPRYEAVPVAPTTKPQLLRGALPKMR